MGSTNDNHYTTSASQRHPRGDSNPQSSAPETDALSIWPLGRLITSSGTRTRNLTLRRGAPYPLGHGGRKNSLPNTGVETAWVSAKRRKKKRKIGLPGVGFEPTRTLRPADLKSAPLDPSGIQAKKFLRGGTLAHAKKTSQRKKIYPWRDLNPQSSDS